MRVLLDTHAFLWFVLSDSRLSVTARDLILDPGNQVEISIVGLWEIAVKISIGKYQLSIPFPDFVEEQIRVNWFTLLPITVSHLAEVAVLPLHHRDPFDRLLIAQAMTEHMPIVSTDTVFDAYPVTRLW